MSFLESVFQLTIWVGAWEQTHLTLYVGNPVMRSKTHSRHTCTAHVQRIIANLREPQIICSNALPPATKLMEVYQMQSVTVKSHSINQSHAVVTLEEDNQQICLQTPQAPPPPQTAGRTRLIYQKSLVTRSRTHIMEKKSSSVFPENKNNIVRIPKR